MTEISEEEFWDNVNVLPPLLRLGYSDGPGAFISSEPWELRRCTVTGKTDYTYSVSVVLDVEGKSQFFKHNKPMTINEFMALCDRIMPGVGVCDGVMAGNCWMRTAICGQTSSIPFARAKPPTPPFTSGDCQ